MQGLTFLSAWFCPFAQRTRIALEEAGLDYQLFEVALKNKKTGQWFQYEEKPQWFRDFNPLGKVPVLVVKPRAKPLYSVYESNICNEFIREYVIDSGQGQGAMGLMTWGLLSDELDIRTHQRIVIDRFNSRLIPNFYSFLVRQDQGQQQECADQITSEMNWLESQADLGGPFFFGEQFSLVDAALVPWFLRQDVLEKFRGYRMPTGTTKLQRWMNHMMERPSVQITQTHPDRRLDYWSELMKHYEMYATGEAKSTSARDFA